MRRVQRPTLPAATLASLHKRTARILDAAEGAPRKAEAERLWGSRTQAVLACATALRDAAPDGGRCMYCEDSEGTDIDHFWPKATFPECTYVWDNHLWACSGCNSNHKRERFPRDPRGRPLLLDPTVDDPHAHLWLSTRGHYSPSTAQGEASIEVYGLNRATLVRARSQAWTSLQRIIVSYHDALSRGDDQDAHAIEAEIRASPHATVLVDLLRVAGEPDAHHYLRVPGVLDAIDARPEIRAWAAGW